MHLAKKHYGQADKAYACGLGTSLDMPTGYWRVGVVLSSMGAARWTAVKELDAKKGWEVAT